MAIHQNVTDPAPAVGRGREWRRGLPLLNDGGVILRELRLQDAPSLLAHLNDARVLRYIAPCPSTVEDFRRFIRWTRAERRRGLHACFGIIPPQQTTPAGIIQLWPIERDFSTAEWGFVLGESHWGTGLFARSARLFLDAVFFDACSVLVAYSVSKRAQSTRTVAGTVCCGNWPRRAKACCAAHFARGKKAAIR